MLSATSAGRSPLSPLTQTTLEKHLPGLPTKRFLQQNRATKVDVGCITGTHRSRFHKLRIRLRRLFVSFRFLFIYFVAHHVPSANIFGTNIDSSFAYFIAFMFNKFGRLLFVFAGCSVTEYNQFEFEILFFVLMTVFWKRYFDATTASLDFACQIWFRRLSY